MNSNKKLYVYFIILLFALSGSIIGQTTTILVSSDNSSGSTLTGEGTYDIGAEVTISITLADGYKFVNWTDELGTEYSDQSFTYTVTATNKVFTAHVTLLWQKLNNDIYYTDGNVGIGIQPSADKALTVNGTIHTTEVLVAAMGADFVFEEDYNLRSLEEVEEFINSNKHLPEIPSAKNMQNNGMDLGEMGTKLLQKIEELTLYAIEIKKENAELKEKIEKLSSDKIE